MFFDPHFITPIAHAATEAAAEAENTSAIGTLGLNWKLFAAQLINFAVVLFVLWKWVFTPVAKKLQERTERIEKAMKDAQSTTKEKEEFGKWKETETTKVRSQATAIISSAESQAQKSKQEILEQAKQEQAKVIQQTQEQIKQEKVKLISEAKSELADLVTLATEKVLREKLDGKKDEELTSKILKSI